MIVRRMGRKVLNLFGKDYVLFGESILPPKRMRYCGAEFKSDEFFLVSAQREAERLIDLCGLTVSSHVLDVGCGPGRLPIGILSSIGEIEHYQGIDVDRRSIQWCQRHITKWHPTFQFLYVDVNNPRYNPRGCQSGDDFRIPLQSQRFDIIYLYSVFSHIAEEDMRNYLGEFRKLLSDTGSIFLTGFIEEKVPNVTVNPDDYRMHWKGPLHCVRYEKAFLESILDRYGVIAIRRRTASNTPNGV